MLVETFGGWLRASLKRKGWSQGQLAIKIDVSPATVSRWLSGGRPDPEYAGRLAVAFEEPLHKVYELAGHPSEYQPASRQPLSLREATLNFEARMPIEVPVVDQLAAAGEGQVVLDYVYLAPNRIASRGVLAIRITGDSMEPEIRHGDVVIFDREVMPEPGDVVVASVNNEIVCKRLQKKSDHYVLAGTNGIVIPADDVAIAGKVIQIVRDIA